MLRFRLGSENTLLKRVEVFEQRNWLELDVVALEDVEAGQAPQLALERGRALLLAVDDHHLLPPRGTSTVSRVFPDHLVHLDQRFFRHGLFLRATFLVLLCLFLFFDSPVLVVFFRLFVLAALAFAIDFVFALVFRREVDDQVRHSGRGVRLSAFGKEDRQGLFRDLCRRLRRAVKNDRELKGAEGNVTQV